MESKLDRSEVAVEAAPTRPNGIVRFIESQSKAVEFELPPEKIADILTNALSSSPLIRPNRKMELFQANPPADVSPAADVRALTLESRPQRARDLDGRYVKRDKSESSATTHDVETASKLFEAVQESRTPEDFRRKYSDFLVSATARQRDIARAVLPSLANKLAELPSDSRNGQG